MIDKYSIHVATVPNNAEGLRFIKTIRETQRRRKSGVKVQVYGRGHRYGKGRIRGSYKGGQFVATNWDNRYQSSLPRHLATSLAVYLS